MCDHLLYSHYQTTQSVWIIQGEFTYSSGKLGLTSNRVGNWIFTRQYLRCRCNAKRQTSSVIQKLLPKVTTPLFPVIKTEFIFMKLMSRLSGEVAERGGALVGNTIKEFKSYFYHFITLRGTLGFFISFFLRKLRLKKSQSFGACWKHVEAGYTERPSTLRTVFSSDNLLLDSITTPNARATSPDLAHLHIFSENTKLM